MPFKGLSAFIKHRREELGLTQKEFADRFNLSIRALRSLEQGHSNVLLNSTIKIVNALGYDLIPGDFVYTKIEENAAQQPNLEQTIEVLQKYKPILQKKFLVEKIGVFGSVARNEQKIDSDLDILVQFKQKANLKIEAALVEYLKRILVCSRLDVLSTDRINPEFHANIERELKYA